VKKLVWAVDLSTFLVFRFSLLVLQPNFVALPSCFLHYISLSDIHTNARMERTGLREMLGMKSCYLFGGLARHFSDSASASLFPATFL
jgi:hypothetical protein